ncbi:MAG: hypothetical protein K0R82_2140 [Flavipsychrobacter sp.]|jgi:hypothetical protein|nr:hypothetical protein [Flavipsychrobacter sp.]
MSGIIADAQTGLPMYGVTIVNMSTQQSTYSDEDGQYSISAHTGDDVAFSFIGYKDTKRSMPPSTGTVTYRVELAPSKVQLGEIVVRPDYTPYQIDSIRRRSTYQRTLAREKSNFNSPVSMLAEKVGGKSKQLYKFQKNFVKWENERFVDSRYTPEIVTKLTGLTGDNLGQFMVAYPIPYDYARAATDMELAMWIRSNYRQWSGRPEQHLTNKEHEIPPVAGFADDN